jgi:hypothetical protein
MHTGAFALVPEQRSSPKQMMKGILGYFEQHSEMDVELGFCDLT